MGEETLRSDLTKKQVKDLVARLKDSINFKVINAGKNFWYVGLKADEGPPRSNSEPGMMFDGFYPQNNVGIIRKSSASLIIYKDSDRRSEYLRNNGYYDKLRQVIQEA